MRRPTALVAPLFAALAAGCPPAPVCGDAECAAGFSCFDGACVPEEARDAGPGVEAPRPRIDGIDGDGSALPLASAAPAGVAAAHRTRGAMIVRGAHLDVVTGAFLSDAAHRRVPLAITAIDGETMRLTLPSSIAPGLFTLTLAAAFPATAEVFLLQGEPGPATLVEPRDPTSCPNGGLGLAFGVDADGNGVLDAAEVTDTRDVCGGDGVFDCTSGTCTASQPLAAPALDVGGRPVATHIDASSVLNVPGDFPTVAAALASLDGISLDADVTVRVAAGVHNEPAEVRITRQDAQHIHIVGDDGAVLHFTSTSGIVVDGTRLGLLSSLTIEGNDAPASIGVAVASRSTASIAADVVVQGFNIGVVVIDGSLAFADGMTSRNNRVGYNVIASRLVAQNAQSLGNSADGFIVDRGGTVESGACVVTGSVVGVAVVQSSVAELTTCVFTSNTTGLDVEGGAFANVASSTFSGNTDHDVVARSNSTLDESGASLALQLCDTSAVCLP